MINHIDLSSVLRRTVCDLYSDLVTRPTGAAVRDGIERQLAELGDRTLTVIDFSHVGLLDYSCADEIVAKLLMRYCAPAPEAVPDEARGRDAYFLFRGVSDSHLDAIETVLERHALAIVAETHDGATMLVGAVGDDERRAWEAMCRLGRVAAGELARELGLQPAEAEEALDTLCRRRLAMRLDEAYLAVGAAP
ncbi:MAG TPA: hypothetical protein VF041_21200 [Gemmatimonadaceae bacterium]